MVAIGMWTVLFGSPTWACGGFFCQTIPVEQAAERVVFAVNETANTTEMHVQVSYAGGAPEFAWIVPVSGVPDLFISADALFSGLAFETKPLFALSYETDGTCRSPWSNRTDGADVTDVTDVDSDDNDGVDVIASRRVGPYETVTLQANSSAELLAWLRANQYQLPDALEPALAPYVAANQYFVALRLANDTNLGDLRPLGLRYAGTTPTIPIRLTSVAATPDMRLEVFLFGQRRYVPESYLHVAINEALISWTDGGSNYPAVITRAADEAGGHAFATDFAGSTSPFRDSFYPQEIDLSSLRGIDEAGDYVEALFNLGALPGTPDLLAALEAEIPVPASAVEDGYSAANFYDALARGSTAWDDELPPIDGDAVTDGIQAAVVDPLIAAERLVRDYPYLTRLTSSISPVEMTVDPSFVANDTMGDVAQVRQATMRVECDGRVYEQGERRFTLSDGRVVWLPAYADMDTDDATYLAGVDLGAAAERIESTGASGPPSLMNDNLPGILAAIDLHNQGVRAGCGGCDGGGASAGWLALGLLGTTLRRRR
jgi:hypothetical protein